jgi:hypothetical protein
MQSLYFEYLYHPPLLLGLLKEQVEGRRFHNNEEVEVAVCEWLQMQDCDLYHDRSFKLVPRFNRCVSLLLRGGGGGGKQGTFKRHAGGPFHFL